MIFGRLGVAFLREALVSTLFMSAFVVGAVAFVAAGDRSAPELPRLWVRLAPVLVGLGVGAAARSWAIRRELLAMAALALPVGGVVRAAILVGLGAAAVGAGLVELRGHPPVAPPGPRWLRLGLDDGPALFRLDGVAGPTIARAQLFSPRATRTFVELRHGPGGWRSGDGAPVPLPLDPSELRLGEPDALPGPALAAQREAKRRLGLDARAELHEGALRRWRWALLPGLALLGLVAGARAPRGPLGPTALVSPPLAVWLAEELGRLLAVRGALAVEVAAALAPGLLAAALVLSAIARHAAGSAEASALGGNEGNPRGASP